MLKSNKTTQRTILDGINFLTILFVQLSLVTFVQAQVQKEDEYKLTTTVTFTLDNNGKWATKNDITELYIGDKLEIKLPEKIEYCYDFTIVIYTEKRKTYWDLKFPFRHTKVEHIRTETPCNISQICKIPNDYCGYMNVKDKEIIISDSKAYIIIQKEQRLDGLVGDKILRGTELILTADQEKTKFDKVVANKIKEIKEKNKNATKVTELSNSRNFSATPNPLVVTITVYCPQTTPP
jgi:hypothetical protein